MPLIHGEKFRAALDDHKKPYEWVVYTAEGHGFNKRENRIDYYKRIEAFLQKHLTGNTLKPNTGAASRGNALESRASA